MFCFNLADGKEQQPRTGSAPTPQCWRRRATASAARSSRKKQLTRDRTSHMEHVTCYTQTWLQVEAGSAGAFPARGIELQLSARTAAVSNVRTQRNVTVKIVSDWSRSRSRSRVRRVGMQSTRKSLFERDLMSNYQSCAEAAR